MQTNGCTYGEEHHCGSHGKPYETSKYQKPGAVTRTAKASPTERWGKHWSERRQKPMAKFMAERSQYRPYRPMAVRYEGPGYKIRKKIS